MTIQMYYQKDCNPSEIKGKVIAIIGYGSQGHAHAQNLRDSGIDVIIGLKAESTSKVKAEKAGFKVFTTAEAVQKADLIMILLPDELQADVYKNIFYFSIYLFETTNQKYQKGFYFLNYLKSFLYQFCNHPLLLHQL